MHKYSSFWQSVRAKKSGKMPRIGFADIEDPRIHQAAEIIQSEGFAFPVMIGENEKLKSLEKRTKSFCQSDNQKILLEKVNSDHLSGVLSNHSKNKNLSQAELKTQLNDSLILSIALLLDNQIDGLVAGSLRPTADVVKAALNFIGPLPKVKFVAGHFFVESEHLVSSSETPFLFADCAVMPEPSARALASIAIEAAAAYRFFTGKEPKVGLLSFSTRGSAEHPLVDRIREALGVIKKHNPDLLVDGEIQADAALDLEVAQIKKAGDSNVAGQVNIFIFPTLEAGNISYKLVQRFANARVAGPLLWGLTKPISDLSRGCSVSEVVDSAACVKFMIEEGKEWASVI